MGLQFSDSTNKTGIVEQTRSVMRVDSTQWPIVKIVNSANHWKDFVTGYAIGADKRFQWDNTNHTALPEGTIASTTSSDYSFQTDEQGNTIITLLGVSRLENGKYVPLKETDRNDPNYDASTYGTETGTPTEYDKIADNIIRLNKKVGSAISGYFMFYFQRTSPYYTASSTTETTGFSPLLDRGFVVACAYDGALTLGLPNIQALSVEREKEEQKVIQYFADRNQDMVRRMTSSYQNTR